MIGFSSNQLDSKRYWFYARRSSSKQTESLDQQLADFDTKFDMPADAERMPPVTDTISATRKKIDQRPGFNELLDKMQEGDHLVIWRMDRLGRNFIEMLQTAETIADKKVWLHSLRESGGQRLDMSSMEAKVFVQVLMIGHSMYVHYMKQNVARATESKKDAGLAYTAVPKRCHKRLQIPAVDGKALFIDVWDDQELARYKYCYDCRMHGMRWNEIGEYIYEQGWTYRVSKSVIRQWVKKRPNNWRHPYRVEHIIQSVACYTQWLKEEILPGMKNDTDLTVYGQRPTSSASEPSSVSPQERSEETDPPASPPQ